MTIKVKAANMMPINFKARLSAIAKRPSKMAEKSPFGVPTRAFPSLQQLVNSTNQIVSDAADNDHGRDGPEHQNWHVRLLLIGCPHSWNADLLPLVPVFAGQRRGAIEKIACRSSDPERSRLSAAPAKRRIEAFGRRAPAEKRIQKWSGVRARYRGGFCRPVPKLFQ
jgi:hypothetical protein